MSIGDEAMKALGLGSVKTLDRNLKPPQKRISIRYIRPVPKKELQALNCDAFYELVPKNKKRQKYGGGSFGQPRAQLKQLVQADGKPIMAFPFEEVFENVNCALRGVSYNEKCYRVVREYVDTAPFFQLWEVDFT